MSIRIRVAGASDAEPLAALSAVTFPLACPPHTTDAAKADFIATVLSAKRFAGYVADPGRIVLVAEQAADVGADPRAGVAGLPDARGALLGYVMLVAGEPGDADAAASIRIRPTVQLSKFYVALEHHGAGVAADLMRDALAQARGLGAAGVWLGVNNENARAQRFYAKHGFERVGTKHFLVGGRLEDDFVMERPL